MKVTILPAEYTGDPEALSMLQAFYSRSIQGINERLAELGTDLSRVKNSLHQFYVGYGHASIADCGDVVLFIEGVSLPTAKAIQASALYNGQECSTRYIKMDVDALPATGHMRSWGKLHQEVLAATLEGIKLSYPRDQYPDVSDQRWQNAVAAHAFDIARGWLPAGIKTNLSWSTTLRKAVEESTVLLAHPLREVRELAAIIRSTVFATYPNVKPDEREQIRQEAETSWLASLPHRFWYAPAERTIASGPQVTYQMPEHNDVLQGVVRLALDTRPPRTPVPAVLNNIMTFTVSGMIDYGSWRDFQRHRPQRGYTPELTPLLGMHPWYLEQFEHYASVANRADLIREVKNTTAFLYAAMQNTWNDSIDEERVLSCPLASMVNYRYKMDLAQAIYFAELRSGPTVHPTLRPIAQEVGRTLSELGMRNYVDMSPSVFSLRRGSQTITKRETP